ncbi:MAG: YggT family protein [bacterium]|nr:YggT family protein [bacterium]MBU1917868.1 YggT family protein [bacterium]
MFSLGYILIATAKIIHTILSMYQFIVLAAVIISWIRPRPAHQIISSILLIVYKLTEPVFYQIRKRLPRAFFPGGMDFTPIIVLLLLYAIDLFVSGLLFDIGMRMRLEDVVQPITGGFQPQI